MTDQQITVSRIGAEIPGVEGDPRLKAIYAAIVDRMKEVVREFEITQDELHVAGDFLNRLGQAGFCRSLVDVALAMTSVDATALVANGTRPNLEGPFHFSGSKIYPDGDLFEGKTPPANVPVLNLSGRVTDAATGAAIPDAVLDFWQADHDGHYDRVDHALYGRVPVDSDGRYRLRTTLPKDYSDHDHDPIGELFRAMGRHNRRCAHIHAKVWLGDRCLLTTQLFIADNPYLDSDYVEGAVSPDLTISPQPVPGSENELEASFDFAVQTA